MGVPIIQYRPVQPESPLETYTRAVQLRSLLAAQQMLPLEMQQRQQQVQLGQLQVQQAQRQAQYEQNWANLWTSPTPPTNEDINRQLGPTLGPAYLRSQQQYEQTRLAIQEARDKHLVAQQDHVGSIANTAKSCNYDPKCVDTIMASEENSADPQWAAQAKQFRQMFQADPSTIQPTMERAAGMSPKQQAIAKDIQVAQIRAAGGANVPLTAAELQLYNRDLPPDRQLPTGSTQKDVENVRGFIQLQQSKQAHEESLAAIAANRALTQEFRQQESTQRSYQFTETQLGNIAKPIDQMAQRVGRITDTLNQRNPQADALVAPELLSVMAGGPGSGVRMNEAEIARIVGGRSVWQNLKASIQHWSTDPTAARSITPAQDAQIRALVTAVQQKLTAKQALMDDARSRLAGSGDMAEHKRILSGVQTGINQIDTPTQTATGAQARTAGTAPAKDPLGIF